jgi:hypothetical protein
MTYFMLSWDIEGVCMCDNKIFMNILHLNMICSHTTEFVIIFFIGVTNKSHLS